MMPSVPLYSQSYKEDQAGSVLTIECSKIKTFTLYILHTLAQDSP